MEHPRLPRADEAKTARGSLYPSWCVAPCPQGRTAWRRSPQGWLSMMGDRPGALRRWLCAAMLTVVVLGVGWLALSPAPPPSVDTGWDKLNHLLAFAVLSFIAQGAAERPAAPQPAIVVGLVLYGLGIEVAQTLVPGRSGQWQDLLANAAGIGLGCALAWAVWRRKPETVVD